MPAPPARASASVISLTTPPTQTQSSSPTSSLSQPNPATSSQCTSATYHVAIAAKRSFRVSNPPSLV